MEEAKDPNIEVGQSGAVIAQKGPRWSRNRDAPCYGSVMAATAPVPSFDVAFLEALELAPVVASEPGEAEALAAAVAEMEAGGTWRTDDEVVSELAAHQGMSVAEFRGAR